MLLGGASTRLCILLLQLNNAAVAVTGDITYGTAQGLRLLS